MKPMFLSINDVNANRERSATSERTTQQAMRLLGDPFKSGVQRVL